jgi:CHAD domain-containing protein/CYTH domain-containing protein
MKTIEIERKFLLRPCSLKKFLKRHGLRYKAVPIEQFYLRSDKRGSERYRRAGERYIHTLKSAGGLVREEREEEVDAATYLRFKARAASGLIEKIRYRVEYRGYTYELDAFDGPLKGLNFLEVEFPSLREAEAFRVPDPFARMVVADVSENPAFTNGALSRSMRLPALSEGPERILERLQREREDFLKASTGLRFGPYEKTGVALRALIFTLTSSVAANRLEILNGESDPERLHQLRVAMRKMRVLFGRFPELFRRRWLERHRETLGELMRATGALRDLDVALERIPEYRKLLSGRHEAGLEALRRFLLKRRSREEKRVRNFLKGERFEKEIGALMRFAKDEQGKALTERKEDPILPILSEKLKKLYKKSIEGGEALDEKSRERDYHRMRIRIKKLRYLVEFFFGTLEPRAAEETLRELKRIQTILGEHQDLTVQRNRLNGLGREKVFSGKERATMLKDLERVMQAEAQKKRKAFRDVFKEFSRKGDLPRRMICAE